MRRKEEQRKRGWRRKLRRYWKGKTFFIFLLLSRSSQFSLLFSISPFLPLSLSLSRYLLLFPPIVDNKCLSKLLREIRDMSYQCEAVRGVIGYYEPASAILDTRHPEVRLFFLFPMHTCFFLFLRKKLQPPVAVRG